MTVNIADDNNRFMREAIKEAAKAYALGECPIGCVIIKTAKYSSDLTI